MNAIEFRLNGKPIRLDDVSPNTTLLDWLRSRGFTGSKEGPCCLRNFSNRGGHAVNHIKPPRMWNYVHLRVELTAEEEAHLCGCKNCLELFRVCLLAETPEKIDWDDGAQKKSA